MTTTNDPAGGPHPEDFLIPYALDALEERDALHVESHLETCSLCREEVAQFLQTAALLSLAVERQTPPRQLESRLMASLTDARSHISAVEPVAPVLRFGFPWPKILAPAAAVVVLLAVSLGANIWFFSQLDKLNQDNSNLAARVLQFSTEDSQLLDFLRQEELASYLMANPSNQPLMLAPPDGSGEPQGVLLLAEDSRHAILFVAGMAQEPFPSSYHVWLLKPDQRVRMGELQVDSSGWGTMSFYYPPESVLRFDKVVLSRDGVNFGETASRDMVLEGSITSLKSSR